MQQKHMGLPGGTARLVALVAVLSVVVVVLVTGAAQGAVNLGTADPFAVLANTTVTNTGSSTINGDVGLYPGTSVTGFTSVTLNGTLHVTDAVAQQGLIDATTAYGVLRGRTPCTDLTGQVLGQTVGTAATPLLPGVYCFSSSAQLTGDLYLSGGGEYIFQIGSTLTTASGSRVILQSGAEACNVFWQVGSSATLGTNSSFAGTIIANTAITANTGAVIEGRLFALTAAVTLDANTITRPTCATPATTTTVASATTTTGAAPTSTTLAPGATTTTLAPGATTTTLAPGATTTTLAPGATTTTLGSAATTTTLATGTTTTVAQATTTTTLAAGTTTTLAAGAGGGQIATTTTLTAGAGAGGGQGATTTTLGAGAGAGGLSGTTTTLAAGTSTTLATSQSAASTTTTTVAAAGTGTNGSATSGGAGALPRTGSSVGWFEVWAAIAFALGGLMVGGSREHAACRSGAVRRPGRQLHWSASGVRRRSTIGRHGRRTTRAKWPIR
jgi:hypothetical protein